MNYNENSYLFFCSEKFKILVIPTQRFFKPIQNRPSVFCNRGVPKKTETLFDNSISFSTARLLKVNHKIIIIFSVCFRFVKKNVKSMYKKGFTFYEILDVVNDK